MDERRNFLSSLEPFVHVTLDRLVGGGTLIGAVIERTSTQITIKYHFYGTVIETFNVSDGYNERYSMKILTPLDLKIRAEIAAKPKPTLTEREGPSLRMLQLRWKV